MSTETAFSDSAVPDAQPTDLLHGLTPAQQEAVEFFEGPLQVLAGPGSGKTRVITRRIARLVQRGVHPSSILAITFTNKAAREMQARVDSLLPGCRIWISTFHRFCANVLRRRGRSLGLESNFVIFDKSDQLQVIRHVLNELDLDAVRTPVSRLGSRISHLKNSMTSPERFLASLDSEVGEPFDMVVAQVYPRYQRALLESNAVDFDDLLLHVVNLFHENPSLRAEYDDRFRFVLVDEYQDTNAAQYQIVRGLSVDRPNVCVTGDPDQSIYAWRGANINNILNFERDFDNAKLVRLEQNFRSTGLILRSADQLIAHNRMRKAKSLKTSFADGEPVQLLKFEDARNEADGIARLIQERCESGDAQWSDFALFYRVNSMSRELERALARHRIPFQVAAGLAFYDRAEVRDLLAYLRLIENPTDLVAFQRIVNKPTRGIGKTTQNRLLQWAGEHNTSLMDAAREADRIDSLSKTAKIRIAAFVRLMDSFSLASAGSVSELLKTVVERTSYSRTWAKSTSEQAITKQSNVEELVTAAAQYDELNPDDPSISGFLETTALASDIDAVDESAGRVTLMTLHAAKGLEFPSVFVVGVEHGLIPHERSIKVNDDKPLEEERRLLFVGMTRAMRNLYLTTARMRTIKGTQEMTIPSTFLAETSFEIVDEGEPAGFSRAAGSGGVRHTNDPESIARPGRAGGPERGGSSLDSDQRPAESGKAKASGESSDRHQQLRDRLKASQSDSDRPMLTTGAALLNGDREEVPMPPPFAVGMRVRHPQKGNATVVGLQGFGKRRTVTVEYDYGDRSETYTVNQHCPLQPADAR